MDFKRLNKESEINIFDMEKISTAQFVDAINNIEKNGIILQMAIQQDTSLMVIEYLPTKEHETPYKCIDGDIEFENSLDTIINNDPFGAKYSGKMIREIFENGDKQWIDTALSKMHNQFIVNKLKYIVERGGYGKVVY